MINIAANNNEQVQALFRDGSDVFARYHPGYYTVINTDVFYRTNSDGNALFMFISQNSMSMLLARWDVVQNYTTFPDRFRLLFDGANKISYLKCVVTQVF